MNLFILKIKNGMIYDYEEMLIWIEVWNLLMIVYGWEFVLIKIKNSIIINEEIWNMMFINKSLRMWICLYFFFCLVCFKFLVSWNYLFMVIIKWII